MIYPQCLTIDNLSAYEISLQTFIKPKWFWFFLKSETMRSQKKKEKLMVLKRDGPDCVLNNLRLLFLVPQVSQVDADPHSPVRDSWGGVCCDDRGTDWGRSPQCQPVLWTLLQFLSGTTKGIKRDRPCYNMA